MTIEYSGPPTVKSSAKAFRLAGGIINILGFAYIGLIAGSWIGTLLFKMRVLGFWDGLQDFGAGFYNPLELFWRVIALGPGLLLLWGAEKLERQSVARGLVSRSDEIRNRAPSVVATTIGALMLGLAVVILAIDNPPDPYRYAVYQCSGTNCRDHEAGYAWAEKAEVVSPYACAVDRSRTYREGCRYSVERFKALSSRGS